MLAVKFTANEFRKQFVLEKSAANGRTAQLQRLCGKAIGFLWETFLQTNEIEPNSARRVLQPCSRINFLSREI